MEIVRIRKNNVHAIYGEVHQKSYAALVLLNSQYDSAEKEAWDNGEFNWKVVEGKKPFWKAQVAFNTRFLRKQLNQHGKLTCVYCQKTDLIIDSPIKKVLATADHIVPTSKGGAWFDEKNLVVACSPCNNKKGDKTGYLVEGRYTF